MLTNEHESSALCSQYDGRGKRGGKGGKGGKGGGGTSRNTPSPVELPPVMQGGAPKGVAHPHASFGRGGGAWSTSSVHAALPSLSRGGTPKRSHDEVEGVDQYGSHLMSD